MEASMREEDQRGNSGGLISREGRGPLSYGEQRALEQQHRNQRLSAGTPAEVEQRQAARAVDAGMKRPTSSVGANNGTPAAQRRGG
jgi:hypothetical protein